MSKSPVSSSLTLASLHPGESGIVERIEASEEVQMKLYELGLLPGEPVRVHRAAPWGGPLEIEVLHYRLAIRLADASRIVLRPAC